LEPERESLRARQQLGASRLWLQAEPVAAMEVGAPLWAALLNSKVVMFYVIVTSLPALLATPPSSTHRAPGGLHIAF